MQYFLSNELCPSANSGFASTSLVEVSRNLALVLFASPSMFMVPRKLVLMVLIGLYLQPNSSLLTLDKSVTCCVCCRITVHAAYALIVDGGGWAGQMVYLVNLQQYALHHIMPDDFEVGFAQQVLDIFFAASEKVIQANDLQQCIDPSLQQHISGHMCDMPAQQSL